MILKRLVQLTLPILVLVGRGSVAEALTSPASLTATAVSTSQIRLSWIGTTQGGVSYSIERSLSSTSGFVQIGNAGRSTSYTSSGLAPGTRYYYRARAIKNGSTSLYSNVAGATTFGVVTTTTFTTTTLTTSTTSTTLPSSSGPVANAGPDQFTQTLTTVAFNGSGSFDSGGTIMSYAWTFGDGGSASGMSASHAYAAAGAYNVTLTVTDSRGMRASDSASVQVANRPPVANAGPDQTAALGSPMTFNGAGSSDPDGTIAAYAWSFGDGASATGSTVTHSYAAAGTYTATLTVTDNRGAQGRDTALATVAGSAGSPQTWVRRFGSAAADFGNGVAVDGSGNVVVTGRVEGAADFGGGVICPAYSIFVAKYSAAAAPLWCKCFPGTPGNGGGRAVAVDGSGNVLVTGYFFGTVDFGGGPLVSAGGADIFVAKYSPSGMHLWSRRFGSPTLSGSESGNAIAVDGSGNVAVTGIFEGTADFGGGPFTPSVQRDIFIAKYSATGAHIWSKHALNATGAASGNGIAMDGSGNVVATGSFLHTVDLGGGTLTSPFGQAIFVTKYSPSGAHLWSKVAGGWTDAGNAAAIDAAGNVLVTGQFGNWLDFGTGAIPHGGSNDIFLAKFTSAGAPVWVKTFGATEDDWGAGVAVDGSGNVVITGAVGTSANFGGGTLFSHGSWDVFVAKLSPAGTHLWSQVFGSPYIDTGNAVAMGPSGNVLVTGTFEAAADFGSGLLSNAGGTDIFLLSHAP